MTYMYMEFPSAGACRRCVESAGSTGFRLGMRPGGGSRAVRETSETASVRRAGAAEAPTETHFPRPDRVRVSTEADVGRANRAPFVLRRVLRLQLVRHSGQSGFSSRQSYLDRGRRRVWSQKRSSRPAGASVRLREGSDSPARRRVGRREGCRSQAGVRWRSREGATQEPAGSRPPSSWLELAMLHLAAIFFP